MLENLKSLKDDMVQKQWTICSFLFTYRGREYIVLVKRFIGNVVRRDKYALVQLHFLRSDDLNHHLLVEANSQRLIVGARELREYFEIEWGQNLGDIMSQFTECLGQVIPTALPELEDITVREKNAMIRSLSNSDLEDPNKIYCNRVMRNGNGQRTVFNSDKTKLLRPDLYEYFRADSTISFCYFDDFAMERSDEEILKKFSQNNK